VVPFWKNGPIDFQKDPTYYPFARLGLTPMNVYSIKLSKMCSVNVIGDNNLKKHKMVTRMRTTYPGPNLVFRGAGLGSPRWRCVISIGLDYISHLLDRLYSIVSCSINDTGATVACKIKKCQANRHGSSHQWLGIVQYGQETGFLHLNPEHLVQHTTIFKKKLIFVKVRAKDAPKFHR
jgi:hypothetical protein